MISPAAALIPLLSFLVTIAFFVWLIVQVNTLVRSQRRTNELLREQINRQDAWMRHVHGAQDAPKI